MSLIFLVRKSMSRCGAPQSPFLSAKGEKKFRDSKNTLKWLSSYLNIYISNRRKLNSKKGLCGAPHLDMLFLTKKIKDIELIYWVDAKVSADFFSFLCFKFLLKQNTINQQHIYHCYL